jgi:hypothetical protein
MTGWLGKDVLSCGEEFLVFGGGADGDAEDFVSLELRLTFCSLGEG